MRVHVLLAVLLFAALVTDTAEAGWFRRVWRGIKRTVKKVGDWVRNHCVVGNGIGCTFRLKRAVDFGQLSVSVDHNVTSGTEGICAIVDSEASEPFEGFPREFLEGFFAGADTNKDNELSQEEFSFFVKTIVLYERCMVTDSSESTESSESAESSSESAESTESTESSESTESTKDK